MPDEMLENNLRQWRREQKLTQQDLADRVGVTRQTIIAIEKGQYNPSVMLALKLAHALHCSVETLFWLADNQTSIKPSPA